MTEFDFSRNTSGLQQRIFGARTDHTLTGRTPGSGRELDALPTPSAPNPFVDLKDVLPAALPSTPEQFRPTRAARYKIICSYQNFFEQQNSSSRSFVHFMVGQELEFTIVDTHRGDEELLPFDSWKWSLVPGGGKTGKSRTLPGVGSRLRTNELEPGDWSLIASCRNRNESCSIRLVGDSFKDWKFVAPLMPKARMDPDAYASRLSSCLEKDSEGKTCGGAADPSDGNELAKIGVDAELVLERLESRIAKTEGLMRYPIQALYTHRPTLKSYALRAFLSVVDGKWMITDWTCPEAQGQTGWFFGGKYEGGSKQSDQGAIREAFKSWEDGNRYPDGTVNWRVLTPADQFELHGYFQTNGNTDIDEAVEWFNLAGTAFLGVSVVPTPQTKAIGGIGAGICFATSSGLNLYQRTSQGFNTRHDLLENGMDLAMIALSMLGVPRIAGNYLAKVHSGKLQVFGEGLESLFLHGKKVEVLARLETGAGKLLFLVCGAQAIRSVKSILHRQDLSTNEKFHLLVETLGLFALQGLLTVVSRRTDKYVKYPTRSAESPPPPKSMGKTDHSPLENGKPLEGEPRSLKYEVEKPADANGRAEKGESEKTPDGEKGTHLETEKPPESERRAFSEEEGSRPNESKPKSMESETHLDEFPGKTDAKQHETIVSRGKRGKGEPKEEARKPEEPPKPEPVVEPEPPKAWPRETDAPPPPFEKGKPAVRNWDNWFRNERMADITDVVREELDVVAYTEVNGRRFTDYNQKARAPKSPTLEEKLPAPDDLTDIYEYVHQNALSRNRDISAFPNWKHLNLHAEGGLLYKLFRAKLTLGAKISITVEGRKVCGFCLEDLISLAKALGIKELIIIEKNAFSDKPPQTLEWKKGWESWKKNPPDKI